jgi:hypothetical protein
VTVGKRSERGRRNSEKGKRKSRQRRVERRLVAIVEEGGILLPSRPSRRIHQRIPQKDPTQDAAFTNVHSTQIVEEGGILLPLDLQPTSPHPGEKGVRGIITEGRRGRHEEEGDTKPSRLCRRQNPATKDGGEGWQRCRTGRWGRGERGQEFASSRRLPMMIHRHLHRRRFSDACPPPSRKNQSGARERYR